MNNRSTNKRNSRKSSAHKQIEQEIVESSRKLAIINKIANVFLTTPDDKMYAEVLQVILEVTESKYGVFGYVDEDGALVCPSMTWDIWDQCQIPDKDIVFPREKWGGIWERAIIEKKSLYSNGPFNVPTGHIPISGALAVPIIHQNQVIGLLHVSNKATDYDEKDKELLESIANYIAPVLDARLQRDRYESERLQAEDALHNTLVESQQRSDETSALLQGARAVLKHRKFEQAARSIFDSCKNLIGATAGYISLLSANEEQNEVTFLDAGGRKCTVDPNLPMPIRGLREQAYRTGKAVYHNDFSNSQWTEYMPTGHVTLNNVLFAPLIIKEKVAGLLGLGNKPEGFSENDVKIATAFGELAAIALHNSRTLESLEQSKEELRHHQLHLEDQVRARTEELTKTNEQLLQKIEDRKRLEKEILDVSEREKRLIGRNLHDSIGQQLAGIAFMTEVLEQKLSKSPKEASYASKITSLAHQSMNQARGLAKGLYPVDMENSSLTTLLAELATTMKHLFGIFCTFEFDKPVEVEDTEVAIHLYRIAQEAVTNAAKHGRAKNVWIKLTDGKDQATLTVENDGLDFLKKRARGKGMGLRIMEYRAEMIDGSLDIRRRRQGGTVLSCAFPNNKH